MGAEPSRSADAPGSQCTCRCGSDLQCALPLRRRIEHHEVSGDAGILQDRAGPWEGSSRAAAADVDAQPEEEPARRTVSDQGSGSGGSLDPRQLGDQAAHGGGSGSESEVASQLSDFSRSSEVLGPAGASTGASPASPSEVQRQRSRSLVSSIIESRPSGALQIMIENPDDIYGCYTIKEPPLGKGQFGRVSKGTYKATGAVRAIKSIAKEHMASNLQMLKDEIDILKSLNHPNLMLLYETFEDEADVHLVMDLCAGGSLQDRFNRVGNLTELQVACIMLQLLRAVAYLHTNNIVHRDVKADNCLIANKGPLEKMRIKVADMGLSCRFVHGKYMSKPCGTPNHMAPEVLAKKYTHACDVWSGGVVFYQLLSGQLPFDGDPQIVRRGGTLTFEPTAIWFDVSSDATRLVSCMLTKAARKRVTARDALNDEWLKKMVPKPKDVAIPSSIIGNLRNYRRLNKFKRAALSVIASMLGERYISKPRAIFNLMDKDGDGLISVIELKAQLETMQSKEKIDNIDAYAQSFFLEGTRPSIRGKTLSSRISETPVQHVGSAGSWAGSSTGLFSMFAAKSRTFGNLSGSPRRGGHRSPGSDSLLRWRQASFEVDSGLKEFTYMEFLAATFNESKYLNKEMCWAAFRAFDKNGDGMISVPELLDGRMLGQMTEDEARETLEDLDADENGSIDFAKFVVMLCKG